MTAIEAITRTDRMSPNQIADPEKHREYTGQDNALILDNLRKLAAGAPGKVLVRIPLIPGVNDGEEDLRRSAEILRPLVQNLKGIELLRYNALAESKYRLAGKDYTDFGPAQTDEILLRTCGELRNLLENRGEVFCVL